MQIAFKQLAQWLGQSEVAPSAEQLRVQGITTDSRAVVPGNVFVALRGERFDAHDFLDAVVAQGAVAVVVERVPVGLSVPAIVVPDTRVALGTIARQWREQFAIPLIAVTGSNGKTTVKEMLASILSAAFGEAESLATRGNFNNDIGVPLTLFRLQSQHRAAVVELGMNHPGEIAVLADIARPTLALVNNAQREHQEFMATVEAVARENGAVLSALPANGTAVFPAEDDYAWVWRELAGQRPVISFGLNAQADVSASYVTEQFGSVVHVASHIDGLSQEWSFTLAAVGEHNVRNALAASACALGAGIAPEAIVRGLEAFAPVSGRLQQNTASSGALVIDDTYNANPDSVRAAIDVLAQRVAPRVLVLGDMGEVGDAGEQFHEEIGIYARQRGVDHLLGLGEAMRTAVQAFNAAQDGKDAIKTGQHYETIEQINAAAQEVAVAHATVLVKGSRFMKMERVVQHLVGAQSTAPHHQENH